MTKQTKILISVVLSCTILLLLFIPSFADDGYVTIHSGTYVWNDSFTSYSIFTQTLNYGDVKCIGSLTDENGNLVPVDVTIHEIRIPDSNYNLFYLISGSIGDDIIPSDEPFNFLVRSGIDGWLDPVFQTLDFTRDVTVSDTFGSFFLSNTQVIYQGNPFLDVMNMVIDALDVPIFGTFSLWDMLTTVCGLFAVVWLLKLLAGG